MDILIPDSWLRDYLKTDANAEEIAKYLSLSGPSVERIQKFNHDLVYSMEVTTNRVDSANILGVAREASAILPRFDIKADLLEIEIKNNIPLKNQVSYLKAKVDHRLCYRFAAVLIKDVSLKDSPEWMKKRLEMVNVRPINSVVDISNYIMHEMGQPVHTFDYDKIMSHSMNLRASKSGEKIVTLDNQEHELAGNDIIIEDGEGRLIDLAGIMGGLNSAIDENTNNVLLFVQTYNPLNVRQTSMSLAHRTEASALFEKYLDPELVELGIRRGIDLFVELSGGIPENEILDIYPQPYKTKTIQTSLEFINNYLGINLNKNEVTNYLTPLGFDVVQTNADKLKVTVPSFRAYDINIPQDIVEEVARIYGYHNLPSKLMTGELPESYPGPFEFEYEVKSLLRGWGATEIYTQSLVPQEYLEGTAILLKNPMGKDTSHLRNSLKPSLTFAAKENIAIEPSFHLFEIANIYLPRKGDLPDEKMMLGGIFSGYDYRQAKGVIENLFKSLNITHSEHPSEEKGFLPSHALLFKVKGEVIGIFGTLEEVNLIYYEFDTQLLLKHNRIFSSYRPIPKYPAQVEDITFILPQRTKIGEVIDSMSKLDSNIVSVELKDIYQNSFTFRVLYQNPGRTLTDTEVSKLRQLITSEVKKIFGGISKS